MFRRRKPSQVVAGVPWSHNVPDVYKACGFRSIDEAIEIAGKMKEEAESSRVGSEQVESVYNAMMKSDLAMRAAAMMVTEHLYIEKR